MSAREQRRSTSHTRSASPQQRGRRKACQYCYRRKMKCDLVEPTCSNCRDNGKECVPAVRSSRPRPTHGQIEVLESQIESYRDFLNKLTDLPPESSSQALLRWRTVGAMSPMPAVEPNGTAIEPHAIGTPSMESEMEGRNAALPPTSTDLGLASAPRARMRFGVSGNVSAHGPTSAFFDDFGQRDFGTWTTASAGQRSEEVMQAQASAKAAEERHLEVLNIAEGTLDFDGVPPRLAMHLLNQHWNRQHFGFMVTYRPLFTRDMATGGPYFSRLLLNAIFFSVSKFSDRPEVYDDPNDQQTAGRRFLRRVKELLGEALDQSSIPTMQAMLLLSSSLFALGHQSAAWLYSGIATRMIFDMGLHYDDNSRTSEGVMLPAEEVEIRRRVVWAAFVYDKIISLYQGRPVSFDEEQMHVPHHFLDTYEEQELWTPYAFPGLHKYPGAPARAISTFSSLCSLSVIMGRIITHIYADRATSGRPADLLFTFSASLDRWNASMPKSIQYEPSSTDTTPPPHILSLHMVYQMLVILLHRPFVESGHYHTSASLEGNVQMSWKKCEEAANRATSFLSRYRETYTLMRAPYLISYTTYVAATIHVRIAAQRGASSESGRLLRVCIDALRENSATNPGVGKMFNTIQCLMTRLQVSLGTPTSMMGLQESPSQQSLFSEDIDIAAIIRSFGVDPTTTLSLPELAQISDPRPNEGMMESHDNLFGFLNYD